MVREHPSRYSAGNVVVDSSPSLNLYARVIERKKAKQEALDEYDRNRINNINPQGLRDVDREGYDTRLQQAKSFYIENKDKIRKANTPEALQYEKTIRDLHYYINQSKERSAKQEAGMKFYNEKLRPDDVTPDDFVKELHLNDLPIDAEGSQSFDLPKWLSAPKSFDAAKYAKLFTGIKRKPGPAKYAPIEGQPLSQTEIIEERFDTEGKQTIAAIAADRYQNSYSFRENLKKDLTDPTRMAALQKVFVDEFGVAPTMPEHYAAAYTLEMIQPVVTKSRTVPNTDAAMTRREKFAREMNNTKFEQAKVLASLRNYYSDLSYEKRREALGGDVDWFLDQQEVNGTPTKVRVGFDSVDSKQLNVSPVVMESFKDNNDITPDEIFLMPDGTYLLRGEGFNTKRIPRSEYKAAIVNKVLNTNVKIGQAKPPGAKSTTTKPATQKKQESKPEANKKEELRKKYNY